MKKFLELISEEMGKGFEAAGYEAQLGRVTVSNRPDLCEYQCNGAMAGAKKYHKAPIMIANDVAEKLTDSAVFSEVSAVAPGFLNLKVKDSFVCEYLKEMAAAEKFGVEPPEKKKNHRCRLRRPQRCKAAPRRSSALRSHRRKHQADQPLQRT